MPLSKVRLLGLFIVFACAGATAQTKTCPKLESHVSDPIFKRGQVWSYHSRPDEPDSTVTILQIDRLEKVGVVIHVRVDGLRMRNPRHQLIPAIEHMPFSRDAMLLSAIDVQRTAETLPTLEGYDRWRADCGGVYTISVADAVSVAEKTFNAP
jgi:hypothetical protein